MIVDKLKTKKSKRVPKIDYKYHESIHTQAPTIDLEVEKAKATPVQPTIAYTYIQTDEVNKNCRRYDTTSIIDSNDTKAIGTIRLCNLSRVEDERDDDYIDEYFD